MAKRITPINYSARDFDSIKNELVQYARRYYPETFRDFNDASFGALMLDMVSYIGDNLSFYLDYQANESFFDTATERSNIIRHAKQMGFRYVGSPSATGHTEIFCLVPANSSGLGPDMNYMPILKRGSELGSTGGSGYILMSDINYANPANEVVAARMNETTGVPSEYAVKATGKIVSGKIVVERKACGPFERFKRIRLSNSRISEIISVFDDQGREYHQVDFLSQNVLYKEVANTGDSSNQVTSILKPFVVPRRFVLEQDGSVSYMQFGYGSDTEINDSSIVEPSNLVLDRSGRTYFNDTSFDPSKLLDTDKFGVAPSNTNLIITYRVNTATTSNAAAGAVTRVTRPIVEFPDPSKINSSQARRVAASFESYNYSPIVGNISQPSNEEIRRQAGDFFATQNRAVTSNDYSSLVYGMPSQFGAIKRCKVLKDSDSFKRNLNLYVLSENHNGTLTQASSILKQNLKTWILKVKMVNDTIDIIDGKVVNFGVTFGLISDPEYNKYDVLRTASRRVASLYREPRYFGEPIYVTDIYSALNKLDGVVDVYDVKIVRKVGGSYSDTTYNFNENMSSDGRYLNVPDNVCMEMKFPESDIRGAVK
tara:strand:- start:2625 stop:4418 length:1794 start_codon:yes stop_codon:yes gene_type:complete